MLYILRVNSKLRIRAFTGYIAIHATIRPLKKISQLIICIPVGDRSKFNLPIDEVA